ncbi:MAG: prephenate dehydrogenase [Planctomycetes bacterium]|nr:prephenate dehydrogenase [Planctomycetota bacterium]
MNVSWPSVAIVGVGLIGGSIGRALLERGVAGRVIGVGRSRASLQAARRAGAITETALDPGAVAEADLVVVAAGVAAIPSLLDAVDAAVRLGTPLTDAGSTKASIVAAWERRRKSRRGRFVGSHPLAGSHRRGPASADPELFTGRVVVVTPAAATPPRDVDDVGGLWSALGATVYVMNPREHDRILAQTSHAPHVLAAAIAAATPAAALPFTAGGWRDTTRIASGDPNLWAEILLDNAGPVTTALERVGKEAARIRAAIAAGDRGRLVRLLSRAKDVRDALGS